MSIIEKAIAKLNQHQESENGRTEEEHIIGDSNNRQSQTNDGNAPDSKYTAKFEVEKLSVSGIITPDQDVPYLADEFRRIKRPLLANAFGKESSLVEQGNIIMVTSSVPGEGKSFTAANLAISIALEKDYTVMLVDADVAASKITKMFALENSLGLTDLIKNPAIDIGEAIIKTDFPCLSIIPAGARSTHAAELLGSKDMEGIIKELSRRYNNRIIIFDSPPLLATSESSILSEKMGQVVLVVEANKTPQQAVLDSVQMLNKDKPIGLILNKTRKSFNYGQYGGYYAYGEDENS